MARARGCGVSSRPSRLTLGGATYRVHRIIGEFRRVSTPRGRASRVRAYINECTYVTSIDHTPTPGPFVAARGKTATAGGDKRPASSSLSRDSRSPWQQGRSYGPAPREKSRCGRARVLRRVPARGPAGATSTRHAGKTLPGRSRTKPHVLGRHLGKLHRIPLAAPSSESGSIVIVKVALEKPLVERLARRIPP